MPTHALFGERAERTMPPVSPAGTIDDLVGIPDLCAGLFGEPTSRETQLMRDYYRLLAIRAQARS